MERLPASYLSAKTKESLENSAISARALFMGRFLPYFIMIEKKGFGAVADFCQEFLRASGVNARYPDSSPFNRDKLNKKPGIVISNHPGFCDVFCVLGAVSRSDALVMASSEAIKYLKTIFRRGFENKQTINGFLSEHFIATSAWERDKRMKAEKTRRDIRTIKSHIDRGGVFVVFPSGGPAEEQTGNSKVNFKPVFRLALQEISPESMIYCFNVSPQDISDIQKRKRRFSRAIGLDFSDFLRALTPEARVIIKEKYTEANEWLEALKTGDSHREQDSILTKHYWELFGRQFQ
ncbi:MAG: 1-acyl-sn-glycerol-3-phosphate acyltransferase [Patescibacteria group bacterium]|nr:1-acyl-sn-glycerol-3-phosphate acyltransferase [Patescibacteria group bacterium]